MANDPPTPTYKQAPNAPPAKFHLDIHASNMPLAWKNFATALSIYMTANNLDDEPDTRKVAILLNTIGTEALQIFYSFDVDMKKISFKDLLKRFELYFLPKVNISIERHKLFNRKQAQNEDIETYATDLKNISLQCDFGSLNDSLLKDIFSWNLDSSCAYIKERILLERPDTFDAAVELAKTIRNSKIDTKKISQHNNEKKTGQDVNSVQSGARYPKHSSTHTQSRRPRPASQSRPQKKSEEPPCTRCGQVHRVRCPAIGVTCRNCGRKDHFASVCRTRSKAKKFYITLGLGVGSVTEFPDGVTTGGGRPKPWANPSRKALLNFWQDMDAWHTTWNQPELLVDYVKVVAL